VTTGVAISAPILQFTLNDGSLAAGGSILTQVGGVNAATYEDYALTIPLPNPIPLNSRGEISNALGQSCQLFQTPNVVYTWTFSDPFGNQIWTGHYVNGVQINITANLIGNALNPQTSAEQNAGVNPTYFSYRANNLLRYGADPTGQVDSTDAINQWLSVDLQASVGVTPAYELYAPAGTYLTKGGHIINAKQGIMGDGIGRTIFQHTDSSNTLFSLPLYGGSESTVEYGGNRFFDFTCIGKDVTSKVESCWYIKNKTDIVWDHVEVTGFGGNGFGGARDNIVNACTQLAFVACRVLNNGVSLYAPLNWNSISILGGAWSGNRWSMIWYDSQSIFVQTNVEPFTTPAVGAVFLGGCQGVRMHLYCEGDVTGPIWASPVTAFVYLCDGIDIDQNPNNNGIPIGRLLGVKIESGSYSSASGVNFACFQRGGTACSYESISVGSGISQGVVFLTTNTVGNFIGANWSNPGKNAVYQTPTDQSLNFEISVSSGVASLPAVSTDAVYIDNADTSDTATLSVNMIGYQGGVTKYRRLNIGDGRNNVLLQVDGQGQLVNLIASKVFAAALPTTNPGPGTGQLWVNGGVVTRA
jgi:hypothetical protein